LPQWGRRSVIGRLIAADILLQELSKNNPPENGGRFRLCVREVYRPISAQIADWKRILVRETAARGADEGLRRTKMLVADPTRFDVSDPHTWPEHTTGGAADVWTWSDAGKEYGNITIDEYFDNKEHYAADYFERKLAVGEKLTRIETLCLRVRRLLMFVMESVGFENYANEIWHYGYKDQMWVQARRRKGDMSAVAEYGYVKRPAG
jgi:D-alanyl-D-alanine dipeptidase